MTQRATIARMALLVRAKGITRVRPLEGGIDAWLAYNSLSLPEASCRTRCLERNFFAAANAAKFAISRWKLPVASDRVNFSQLSDD
jgi:hypothetical protein